MIICTGHPGKDYEVIDIVFTIDSHNPGLFQDTKAEIAFEKLRNSLRQAGTNVDADAVIDCQFEYRMATGGGVFGNKPVLEIFAYGTAVRFK